MTAPVKLSSLSGAVPPNELRPCSSWDSREILEMFLMLAFQ
jgi:hypothetical protein